MTSDAQRFMLFGLLRKLATARGWNTAQTKAEREHLTSELFGEVLSWSDLDDSQIDRLKARIIAETRSPREAANFGDIDQASDDAAAENGERRRLIHRIETDLRKASLAEGYLRKICVDQFDRTDWRDLPNPQLTLLRDVLATRIWSRRRKAKAAATAPAPGGTGGPPVVRGGSPRTPIRAANPVPEPHPF